MENKIFTFYYPFFIIFLLLAFIFSDILPAALARGVCQKKPTIIQAESLLAAWMMKKLKKF
jgi:hypothetical protein